MDAQTKYLLSTVTASPSDKGLPSCVISTINADRDHDHVIPEGMDASNFLKAPVLMWSHGGADRYAALPIGTVTALSVSPGQGITAEWRWLENDPMADRVRNAWDQGIVRGTSIGFRPKRMEPNAEGGVDHLAWELLELSVCPIPANPEAVRTLKALGLIEEEKVTESVVTELEAKVTEPVVEKRGRVLSAVNESKLRAALDALNEVLAQLMPSQEEPMDEPMDDKPEDMSIPVLTLDAAETYSLTLAEDSITDGLRLTLADDEVLTFDFIADTPAEPTFSVDPAAMRDVVLAAVRERVQDALVGPVGDAVQRALDRARGRVQ